MIDALDFWLKYRDEVAEACGLKRNATAVPRRKTSRKPLPDRLATVTVR
jgi:hypothetical protein